MPSATPTVETGAKRREHFEHIPHKIVCRVFRIHDHDTAPLCSQRRLHGLDPNPGQPVTVFHQNRADLRIGQEAEQRPSCTGTGSLPSRHHRHAVM